VSDADDKTRLITLAEAARLYGFRHSYLSQLAKKGRLQATKSGGTWLTRPVDVESYIRSRANRGVYRDDIQVDQD
jgi:excisionase family DNA binding protein